MPGIFIDVFEDDDLVAVPLPGFEEGDPVGEYNETTGWFEFAPAIRLITPEEREAFHGTG